MSHVKEMNIVIDLIFNIKLNRLLGFRRATPVTGRSLNVTTEMYELSEPEFKQTFFVSPQPDSNLCFYGICRRYCDPYHPICAKNDMVEVN